MRSSDKPSSSGSTNTVSGEGSTSYEQLEINQPHEEIPFKADIHNINGGWVRVKEKTGGANQAGDLGGEYTDIGNPERRVLFKQDTVISKNICEFIAGKLMRVIMPDVPELFARVELAFEDDKSIPDETGKNVYLASEFYSNYTDLYKDAYNAHNKLSKFDALRKNNNGVRPCPQSRPKYIEFVNMHYQRRIDPVIASVIISGRYPNFLKLIVASIFVEDPDVHTANIGVVATKQLAEEFEDGEIIYEVEAVRIDFGGAFADEKRKLDGNLHYEDTFRFISLTNKIPPNYFQTYPKTIYKGQDFYLELLKLSCFPPDVLITQLKDILGQVGCYYGREPLISFAKFIGLTKFLRNTKQEVVLQLAKLYDVEFLLQGKDIRYVNVDNLDKEAVLALITIFMGSSLIQRLAAAESEAKKISRILEISDNEFDNNKLSVERELKKSLAMEVKEQNTELEQSEYLITAHDEILKEMLIPIHNEIGKIISQSTRQKKLGVKNISSEEIDRITKIYTAEPIKKLLTTYFDMEQIHRLIERNPEEMKELYPEVLEASKMFNQALNNERRNALLSLLKFSEKQPKILIDTEENEKKESVSEDDREPVMNKDKVIHILSIISYALNDYLKQPKKKKLGLFSQNHPNTEEASLAMSLLTRNISSSDRFEVIYALFSLENKAPELREFLIEKVKEAAVDPDLNINNAFLNKAILHFMREGMKYDVSKLKVQVHGTSLYNFLKFKDRSCPMRKNINNK